MYGTYKIYKDGKLIVEQKNKLTVLGRANALKAMLGQNQYFANCFGIGVSDKSNGTDTFLDMTDLGFTVGKYPITTATLGTASNTTSDGLVYTARINDTSRFKINEIGLFSNTLLENVMIDDLTIFNFEDGDPIKEKPSTFTATITNANPAVFTSTTHGLINGDTITLTSSGTLPGGLQLNTIYYVINSSANTFNVSLTYNGSAVGTTSAGTGTHTINPTTVYINDSTFLNRRSATLVSDLQNYRIGSSAVKVTGNNKTIFFDDASIDFSDVENSDTFTLAAYYFNVEPSTSTYVILKFYSGSLSASGTFVIYPGYNVISIGKDQLSSTIQDWSVITKIEITTASDLNDQYILLDGLKVKKYQSIDAIEGLVSRAVLSTAIEKSVGSIIDIQYILSMELST